MIVDAYFHFLTLVGIIVLNKILPATMKIRFYVIVLLLVEAGAEWIGPPLLVGSISTNKLVYTLRLVTLLFALYCAFLSAVFTEKRDVAIKEKNDQTIKSEEKQNNKQSNIDLGPNLGLKYSKRIYGIDSVVDQYQIQVYCGVGATKPDPQVTPPIIKYHKERFPKIDINTIEFAKKMDNEGTLTSFRQDFLYPDNTVYLCGNSLGLQPKNLSKLVNGELEKWAKSGVKGHFEGDYPWFNIEDFLIEKMAKVVGAKPLEVAVMNSLTANLHMLLVAFYRPTTTRYKILIEENPFPSDMHAITTHVSTRSNFNNPEDVVIQIGPRQGEDNIRNQDIINLLKSPLGDEIAVVMLSGVHFMTGQFFDVEMITRVGHERGITVGFDLAHAAGNIDLKLHDWDVDFACWCTYKYLNSGPGNIAGIFVHEKFAKCTLQELPRYSGWWGHKRGTRFTLTNKFDPQEGAAGFQMSNPSILGCMSLIASLDVFNKTTMCSLRTKSQLLTSYLELLLSSNQWENKIKIITPKDPEQRGCQISIRISKQYPVMSVMNLLDKQGVICDEREPDVIRISPVPLYNSFEDVYHAVVALREAFKQLDKVQAHKIQASDNTGNTKQEPAKKDHHTHTKKKSTRGNQGIAHLFYGSSQQN
jgi:kynureninase